ncbi:MAG: nickel pincer cofactor biosynthesis protein LarC [Elusimicrobiota bacterium]
MILFDCFNGASGDMLVGALLDTADEPKELAFKLKKSGLEDIRVDIREITKNSLAGTRVKFKGPQKKLNTLDKIKSLAGKLKLSQKTEQKLMGIYTRIFKAEAAVHGVALEEVHLHEIGGLDTFAEILSFLLLTEGEKLYCKSLAVGGGTLKTAHGEIPLPAPATAEIIKDMPVRIKDKDGELLTPTGAAILKETVDFNIPDIITGRTGYGIGKRSILRVIRGKTVDGGAKLNQISFNVDDMTGEDIGYFIEKLSSLAVDVWLVPVLMKKGRPGHKIEILCKDKNFERVKDLILKETSTAGFRVLEINRRVLDRDMEEFNSSYGKCRIKKYRYNGGLKYKPEYEDLKKLAGKSELGIMELRKKIMEEFKNE